MDHIGNIFEMMRQWDRFNHAWDNAREQLNHFHAPPDCPLYEQFMFAIFAVPDLMQKLELVLRIHRVRVNAIDLLCFMDTLYESMREMSADATYNKIYLASIVLAKFRNEDIALKGTEKFANLLDFLQRIALHPTPTEMFQSRRWNKLKKTGKLATEISKSAAVMDFNVNFNQIRAKAIKFGSAVEPQNKRYVKPVLSKEEKQQRIQAEIGSAVDTKALQNTLQSALAHKFGAKKSSQADNDADDAADVADDDGDEEKKMADDDG